jgi:hypothetical protein
MGKKRKAHGAVVQMGTARKTTANAEIWAFPHSVGMCGFFEQFL